MFPAADPSTTVSSATFYLLLPSAQHGELLTQNLINNILTIKNGFCQFFSCASADVENLMKNLYVDFLVQKILTKSKIKKFWPHSFTTCRTPLYCTHIVMLNEAVAHVSPCF